jgi:hypothetical protein
MRDFFEFDETNFPNSGESNFTRICVGFVDAVDEDNGTVSIALEDFPAQRNGIELTFPYISSVSAGWFRFIPSRGDRVLVGFRPSNEMVILGYKAISYAQYAEFAAAANPPFLFRKLRSGEFEIMSSGYAEIWGSNKGLLHLAGGLCSIDLDPATNQISQSAALHYLLANQSSEFRFGSQIRTNPLSVYPDINSYAPGVPFQEYRIALYQSFSALQLPMYDASIGNVYDYIPGVPTGVFTPRLHPTTKLPLVADINIYTKEGVQKVRFTADSVGNVEVDMPSSAVDGFRLLAALGSVIVNALNINLTAAAQVTITGATKVSITSATEVDVTAPQININGDTANVLTSDTAISDFTGDFIGPGNPTVHSS